MISTTQLAAVRALAERDPGLTSCTAEARASLVDLATSINWHDGHLEAVLAMLDTVQSKAKAPRRCMQHFAPGIVGYFTKAEWEGPLLQQVGGAMNELVLNRLIALGGRTVDEPSLKFCNSLLLFLQYGEAAMQWARGQKKDIFDKFKAEFHRRIRHMECAQPHLVDLPTFPGELRTRHPEVYSRVFPDEDPVPCRVPLGPLVSLDNSYKCRGQSSSWETSAPGLSNMAMQMLLQQMMTAQQQQVLMLPPGAQQHQAQQQQALMLPPGEHPPIAAAIPEGPFRAAPQAAGSI